MSKSGKDAIDETRTLIRKLTIRHRMMKSANALFRSAQTIKDIEGPEHIMAEIEANVEKYGKPYTANHLANNKAKMNRLKFKLVDLQDAEMMRGEQA